MDSNYKNTSTLSISSTTTNFSKGAQAQPHNFSTVSSTPNISPHEVYKTIVRGYDVSLDQFIHVVQQENASSSVKPVTSSMIHSLIDQGPGSTLVICTNPTTKKSSWYGIILYLGLVHIPTLSYLSSLSITTSNINMDSNEYLPLLTFTSDPNELSLLADNPPSLAYYNIILQGLSEIYMNENEAKQYLDQRIMGV